MINNFQINHLKKFDFVPITKNVYSFYSDLNGPFKIELKKNNNLIDTKIISKEDIFGFDLIDLEYDSNYELYIDDVLISKFSTALKLDNNFIESSTKIDNPLFYKNFKLKDNIKRATLSITGVGLYECMINDLKVGGYYLTPLMNDYDFYLRYQTYDVTNYLKEDNKISVILSSGWYKGEFGLSNNSVFDKNIWGDTNLLNLKLLIEYENGDQEEIITDESFLASASYLIDSSIYHGETWDFNKEIKESLSVKRSNKTFNLVPEFTSGIVKKCELEPVLIKSIKNEKILDFKQNMVGFVRIKYLLKKGETLTLKFGEVLQDGCFYNENYRNAKATFSITGDGIKDTFEAKFSYFGFRYCLVEGLNNVDPSCFKGIVISSNLDKTFSIRTDNLMLDRLCLNAYWSEIGNFLDVPTDCPQRDERLGWSGDAQVFSKSAMYQSDCANLFNKYLLDMRLEQTNYYNGDIPMYVPSLKKRTGVGGAVWSDAAIIIPWNLYLMYQDKKSLENNYPLMEDYLNTLINKDIKQGNTGLIKKGFTFGDWLSLDGVCEGARKGATDDAFIMSVYYYNALDIVSKASQILEFNDKYDKYNLLKEKVYNAILDEYFTRSGRISLDTQTAYLLSLYFKIYKDKEVIINQLKLRLKKDFYKLKTGFTGTPLLLPVLLENDMINDAFRILYSRKCPGWMYEVSMGATTIWERWNSMMPDGKVSGTGMNSFNHYAFGSVVEGIYSHIAGLKPSNQGFSYVTIKPKLNHRLKSLDFSYNSNCGLYEISYKVVDSKLDLTIEIPKGCDAEVSVLSLNEKITEGRHKYTLDLTDDLIYKYTLDTPLVDYIEDDKAMKLLKEVLPVCFKRVFGESREYQIESIRELSYNPLMHISKEDLEEFRVLLKTIK